MVSTRAPTTAAASSTLIAPESRATTQQQKQHRACDECRTRKLACSKEPAGCARCVREGLPCHYSPQKQMGRPRKRPRVEVSNDGGATQPQQSEQQPLPTLDDAAALIPIMPDFTTFDIDPALLDGGPNLFDMLGPGLSATFMQSGSGPDSQVEPGTVGPGDQYSGPWGGLLGLDFEVDGSEVFDSSEVDLWTQQPFHAKSHQPPQRRLLNPHLTSGIPFSGLDDLGPEPGPPPSPPSPPSLDSDTSSTTVATVTVGESSDSWSSSHPRQSSYHQHQAAPEELPGHLPAFGVSPDGPCSCLARMYLALDSLQNLPQKVGHAMACARRAAKSAWEVTECPSCSPPDFTEPSFKPNAQSYQNMMILGALLPSIANAYNSILPMIDAEAEACRVAVAAARLKDPAAHAPTMLFDLESYGGLWGRMANRCNNISSLISVKSMDPDTWRSTVRALLRLDVYGLSDEMCSRAMIQGVGPADIVRQIGLKDIVNFLIERSRARHAKLDELVASGEIGERTCPSHLPLAPGQKHTCQQVLEIARISIERLVIA